MLVQELVYYIILGIFKVFTETQIRKFFVEKKAVIMGLREIYCRVPISIKWNFQPLYGTSTAKYVVTTTAGCNKNNRMWKYIQDNSDLMRGRYIMINHPKENYLHNRHRVMGHYRLNDLSTTRIFYNSFTDHRPAVMLDDIWWTLKAVKLNGTHHLCRIIAYLHSPLNSTFFDTLHRDLLQLRDKHTVMGINNFSPLNVQTNLKPIEKWVNPVEYDRMSLMR